jgi:glycosyltransferase involved in cell wall biosynthesis
MIYPNKHRILYLVGGFHIGGTERHLSLILPRLKCSFLDIHIRKMGRDGPFSEPLKKVGFEVKSIHGKTRLRIPKLRAAASFRSQISETVHSILAIRPDAVHCFLPEPCIIGWIANVLAPGRRILIMSKRSQIARPSAFIGDKWLERKALRSADYVLGHSTKVIEELISLDISPRKVHRIHNGIDLQPFDKATRSHSILTGQSHNSNPVVFVMLANLIPYKGHGDFLNALSMIGKENPPWKAIIIGSGNSEREQGLIKLSEELGIKNRVVFMGQRTDITELLCNADVGVLPSHQEGFSNAILEYMAARLPVVASAVGGNKDSVLHGKTGYLIPAEDTNALSNALDRLRRNRTLRLQMGGEGRKRVEENFELTCCVKAYESFYRSIFDI